MAGAAFRGSPELQKIGWANDAKVDLAWEALYSEVDRSSRKEAGLMV